MGRRAEALAHYQDLAQRAESQKLAIPQELTALYEGLSQ